MNRYSARETALQVLSACRTASAWADASLRAQLDRSGMSGADAALCSRIVYGVLQNRLLLDFYLGAYCSQKIDHLQPPLADILRIGAYQILFLDKVPDSAAVNEAVNLAKLSGREKASGLVNAVLRKISLNKDQLPPIPDRDELRRLSIQYSHPRWLVKKLMPLLGDEGTEALLRIDNEVAPLTVQINPLKTSVSELAAELTAAGVTVRPHPWVPGCLGLTGTGNPAALDAFRDGKFLVQDPAARLVSLAAGIRPGDRVLDLCAAPGGKSFGAAFAMEDRGEIWACDLHPGKLTRIQSGAERLGLSCIRTLAADGRAPRADWFGAFDVVLVDAPCSGLGIIRKKPDIRYKTPEELFAMPVIQSALLDNAASYVRPGGILVYSTCTILPEENEQVTDAFLAEHSDLSRESFQLPEPVGKTEGQLTLWPHLHGTDGFYICRMRRQGCEEPL